MAYVLQVLLAWAACESCVTPLQLFGHRTFQATFTGRLTFCGGRGWIGWLKPPPVKSGKKNQKSPDNLIGHLTSKVSGGYSQYSDDTITEGMNVVFSRGCNRRSSIFKSCSSEIYYKNKTGIS